MEPGKVLVEARRRAGLTQAQLAELAATRQPAIARYERGRASPSVATLDRLLAACGLELDVRLVPYQPDVDRQLVTLSPADRLCQVPQAIHLGDVLRRLLRADAAVVVTGSVADLLLARRAAVDGLDLLVPDDDRREPARQALGWYGVAVGVEDRTPNGMPVRSTLIGSGEYDTVVARALSVDLYDRQLRVLP